MRKERLLREDLARWQIAFTIVNHFFFVPLTIGLAFLTAFLQTAIGASPRPAVPAALPWRR